MDSSWILAQAGSQEAPSRIGSEPVDTGGQSTTQTPGSPNAGPGGTTAPRPSSPWNLVFIFVMLALFMYLMLMRGPRKQQQQQRQMIQSLKKNDRVRTIGGIYGTVMDVKGDEVILKIDEATNTKIHVSTSAIGKNLSQEGGKE
jgi:preprotein translocase subunit YajC